MPSNISGCQSVRLVGNLFVVLLMENYQHGPGDCRSSQRRPRATLGGSVMGNVCKATIGLVGGWYIIGRQILKINNKVEQCGP
jgi:hypothetical protein